MWALLFCKESPALYWELAKGLKVTYRDTYCVATAESQLTIRAGSRTSASSAKNFFVLLTTRWMTEIGHLLFNTQSFFSQKFHVVVVVTLKNNQKATSYYLVVRNFFAGQKFLIYIIIVMHFDKLLLDAIRYSLHSGFWYSYNSSIYIGLNYSYNSALGRRFLTRVCINDLTLNWRLFSDILSCWKTYKKDMISSQSKELSFLFTIDARWWSSTWFSCWSVILSSWILWWLKVYIISELLWIVKFHLSVACANNKEKKRPRHRSLKDGTLLSGPST